MTEQSVFAVAVVAFLVAIGLVVAGVAVLAGLGWSLVSAGVLVGGPAVCCVVVLLRRGDRHAR